MSYYEKIIFILYLSFTFILSAEEPFFKPNYTILGFGGIYVNSDLAPISFNLDFKYKPSYMWGNGDSTAK